MHNLSSLINLKKKSRKGKEQLGKKKIKSYQYSEKEIFDPIKQKQK